MILTFPNGQKVEVVFDETAHSYAVRYLLSDDVWSDFRPTHGITAPLAVVPKEFLKAWAGKEAALATINKFASEPSIVENLTDFEQDYIAYNTKARNELDKPVMSYYKFAKKYPWYSGLSTAFKGKAKESTDIGTWVHSAIEHYYKSKRKKLPVLTPDVQPAWDAFLLFDNFYKPTADEDGLEFLVYSMLFGYSGQGDFRGKMSGKTCIGDWKTSNRSFDNPDGISVEYFFQVGGLAQAEYERTGVWPDDLFVANFDKKGEEPRVIWASEFGMSPQDCARAYVSCFQNYHTIQEWDYKFTKR